MMFLLAVLDRRARRAAEILSQAEGMPGPHDAEGFSFWVHTINTIFFYLIRENDNQ